MERLYISGSLYIQRHMRTNECVLDVLSLAPSLLEFFLAATNLMNYQKKKKKIPLIVKKFIGLDHLKIFFQT